MHKKWPYAAHGVPGMGVVMNSTPGRRVEIYQTQSSHHAKMKFKTNLWRSRCQRVTPAFKYLDKALEYAMI